MLKNLMAGLGWILVVITAFNIAVKLLGSPEAVLRYAGNSRNVDASALGLAIGLIFLGISQIIARLDRLLRRLGTPDVN